MHNIKRAHVKIIFVTLLALFSSVAYSGDLLCEINGGQTFKTKIDMPVIKWKHTYEIVTPKYMRELKTNYLNKYKSIGVVPKDTTLSFNNLIWVATEKQDFFPVGFLGIAKYKDESVVIRSLVNKNGCIYGEYLAE